VFINDDERGLHQDYDDWLEELAPHEPISKYRHNRTGEDNGDAHLKRQIMGREVVVAITDGVVSLPTAGNWWDRQSAARPLANAMGRVIQHPRVNSWASLRKSAFTPARLARHHYAATASSRHPHIQPIQDRCTVLAPLDCDPLHVDPGRRGVLVR